MSAPDGPSGNEPPRYAGQRLHQASLDGADLRGADMARAILDQVSLEGADLRGACLCGAELSQVDLTGAKLDGADLRGASLDRVVLDGASLHGVDARGASLVQTSAKGISAHGLNLAGAQLVKLSLVDVTLEACVLDGASLDDVGLVGGTLRDLSMVGLRATGCALTRVAVHGCDLSGASVEDGQLRDVVLHSSVLRAALLRRVRLRGLQSVESQWAGAALDGCRGLGGTLEDDLRRQGAAVGHTPLVRLARVLWSNRPLQIAVVVGLILLVLAVVALLRSPGAWPSSVLLSRFEALEGRSDLERCEPMLVVAAALVDRPSLDKGQRYRLLQRSAECQALLERPDQALDSLRRYVELARDEPEDLLAALALLGRFQLDGGDLGGATLVLEQLHAVAQEPGQRLEALHFEADLLSAQGLQAVPTHPDDRPVDPEPWRSVQLATAAALLDLTELGAHQVATTPVELLVLGEWERAVELIAAVAEPPLGPAERWEHARGAVDRLVEAGQPALALAMLEQLAIGDEFDDLADLQRVDAMVRLHLQLGEPEAAQALLAGLPAVVEPGLAMELSLVRASLLVDTGELAGAEALLAAAELGPDLPFDLRARHGWLLADTRLRGGDEAGAVEALAPVLAAVPDKENGKNLLRELASWMERLAEPQRVVALLEGVDNPMLVKAGQGQELALTTLRARAREGAIQLDDPTLQAVLSGGTPEQIQEAAGVLLDGAAQQGQIEPVIQALLPHARKLADRRARENLGLLLAETAAGAALRDHAVQVLAELDLTRSEDVDVRSRAVALELGIALDAGELDAAMDGYRDAVARPASIEDWVSRNLGRRIVDALQDADRMDEALAQVRALREGHASEGELWLEAMTCLAGMGDEPGFAAELAAAKAAIGPCQANIMATRARLSLGSSSMDLGALEQACASEGSSVEELLAAASVLGRAGRPQAALELAQAAAAMDLDLEQRVQVDRELAGWLAASGDSPGAIALLEASYSVSSDAHSHRQVTDALLGHLAGLQEPGAILAVYLRFTRDHPDQQDLQLWKQAAVVLIRAGRSDLLPELGGQAGWMRHVARDSAEAELRALVDAGDTPGAWAWLERALAAAPTVDQRTELLGRASDMAERGNDHARLLPWLDLLEAQLEPGSSLRPQLLLCRARALEATDDSAGAVAVFEVLLAQPIPASLRDDVLDSYGHSLGRVGDAASIERALAALESSEPELGGPLLALRLRAAGELLARGEPGGTRSLLEPLAGREMEPAQAETCWDLLAQAYAAVGRYPDMLDLPARFTSSHSSCGAWLAVVRHLPAEGPVADQGRDGALVGCAPSEIPVHQALSLAQAVGQADPQRALGLLTQVGDGWDSASVERADIDVERAHLLALTGQAAQARALLEQVLERATQPAVASRAGGQLMGLVVEQGQADASAQVEGLALRALERVGDDQPAARDVVRAAVAAQRDLEAWPAAMVWQQRLVDLHATPDEGRGYALLQLIHLQLDAHPGDPAAAGEGWLQLLAEAAPLATPGSHLHDELSTLQVAWRVLQAGGEPRILAVLEAAVAGDGQANALNAVATRLDAWRQDEAAAVVRRERERRMAE